MLAQKLFNSIKILKKIVFGKNNFNLSKNVLFIASLQMLYSFSHCKCFSHSCTLYKVTNSQLSSRVEWWGQDEKTIESFFIQRVPKWLNYRCKMSNCFSSSTRRQEKKRCKNKQRQKESTKRAKHRMVIAYSSFYKVVLSFWKMLQAHWKQIDFTKSLK